MVVITPEGWESSTSIENMLDWLYLPGVLNFSQGKRLKKRKLHLFSLACCNHILIRRALKNLPFLYNLLVHCEEYIEHENDWRETELLIAHGLANDEFNTRVANIIPEHQAHYAIKQLAYSLYQYLPEATKKISLLTHNWFLMNNHYTWQKITKMHCDLLREIFGNPYFLDLVYSPPDQIKIPAATNSSAHKIAMNMVETIYQTKSYCDMPILADALEDADFPVYPILDHCRQKEPHVHGCWVLDMLLNK
jgi:hypothetical protein